MATQTQLLPACVFEQSSRCMPAPVMNQVATDEDIGLVRDCNKPKIDIQKVIKLMTDPHKVDFLFKTYMNFITNSSI